MHALRFVPLALVAIAWPLIAADYAQTVAADKPAAHWRFDSAQPGGEVAGKVALDVPGPRPPAFPDFSADNRAASFGGKGTFIRIKDPGERSAFDFDLGDTITIEAWMSCHEVKDGQQVYIVGKGRTQNPGVASHNQNWALRLRGEEGTARASFLFRDSRNDPKAGEAQWHRWTSTAGFPAGAQWHHVAVTYTFGKPDSARAFIDGVESSGAWDMGGPTELGPVVDDDEIWIGSSMGGSPNSTFQGSIDEVALHRGGFSAEQARKRFSYVAPKPVVEIADLPKDAVRVEIFEHPVKEAIPIETDGDSARSTTPKSDGSDASWSAVPAHKTGELIEPAFAFGAVPTKYSPRGVKIDRSAPYLIRASGAITLPAGEHRLLVRALNGARLLMDGTQIARADFLPRKYSDNEAPPDQLAKQLIKTVRLLPAGHSEALATIRGDGQPHVFTLEVFVGGKGLRPELGEPSVSVSTDGGPFRLLTPRPAAIELSDQGWSAFANERREAIAKLDAERRHLPDEEKYWKMRHETARRQLAKKPPIAVPEVQNAKSKTQSPVDAFLAVKLAKAGVDPAPLLDDLAFLRRVTLDTAGMIPSPTEIANFLADTRADRRAAAIDKLLADPRWADAWMPYWQDVLAENPAMLKATLNNSGPFRWWLHESLLDNKPLDRFVTELVSMEGSALYGGPAGFSIASQNDVPMASKAQTISSAFLGFEMKCARCHDAVSHSFNQEELFNIAALLQRGPIKVPASSSVPGLSPHSQVEVTLKVGSKVDPHWPFDDFEDEPLPGVIRNPEDTRELLAAIITDPRNERFPQVIANRVWKRFFGWGIVEPVDDWESGSPSHKELLAWLGRELATHDYDLKHLARLILNSQAYQRATTAEAAAFAKSDARLFQAQARRRLTAEQLVDSLFAAAGKEFQSEVLNMDIDARRSVNDFTNFGIPRRAWEFVPLSNERDRPALAKPVAQSILDVLAVYGWRESRPEPRSTRDHDANVLQPAALANGVMGARITRLSDDSAFTALCVKQQPLSALITSLVQRVLSRPPTGAELSMFTELLEPGYSERVITNPAPVPPRRKETRSVSWSSHLHADATTINLALEREVRAGDPPTPRLRPAWRERAEDMIWSLMLSPEFAYLP